jgi:hypothetical protein
MQIDQKMLKRLLSMNDDQLGTLISQIASESGIDPSALGIDSQNLTSIRLALSNATDADLEQLNQIWNDYRQTRKRPQK